MAGKNITIAGAVFNGVPSIDVPVSGGGTASFVEISDTTAQAADVASGKYFYDASGVKTEGTASGGGGVTVESLSVTQNGTYTAPTGKAYSPVTVNVSGGGGGVEPKDVNFYDYDGTLLYSYTAQEAAALSALPANPSHTGLTAQGWNYTLAEMKTQVAATGSCDVGQMYTTSDGKTRIYITIESGTPSDQMTFNLYLQSTTSGGVTIAWGDGDTTVTNSASAKQYSHTYAAVGSYVVEVSVTSGKVVFTGTSGSSGYSIYGQRTAANYSNRGRIRKVLFGDNVQQVSAYVFYYCYGLEVISLPRTATSYGTYNFAYCHSLKHITVPDTVTTFATYCFYYCTALESVSFPPGATALNNYVFSYVCALKAFTLPAAVTSIPGYAFQNCFAIKKFVVPSGVTSIGNYAFTTCYSATEYVFKSSTPPAVGQSTFNGIRLDSKIYVPTDKAATYKATTNYPTATSIIWVEE